MFLDAWGEELFKAAYSFIPRSTVADIINRYGILNVYHNHKQVELLNQVHDSMVFQIPISIGFFNMSRILDNILNVLKPTLVWHDYSFQIPPECKMGFNLEKVMEVKPTEQSLTEAYSKLRATDVQKEV